MSEKTRAGYDGPWDPPFADHMLMKLSRADRAEVIKRAKATLASLWRQDQQGYDSFKRFEESRMMCSLVVEKSRRSQPAADLASEEREALSWTAAVLREHGDELVLNEVTWKRALALLDRLLGGNHAGE